MNKTKQLWGESQHFQIWLEAKKYEIIKCKKNVCLLVLLKGKKTYEASQKTLV